MQPMTPEVLIHLYARARTLSMTRHAHLAREFTGGTPVPLFNFALPWENKKPELIAPASSFDNSRVELVGGVLGFQLL